jgi:hypothetical protein
VSQSLMMKNMFLLEGWAKRLFRNCRDLAT